MAKAKKKLADKALQNYIDKKSNIKIFRTVCGEEANLSGFLLGMSKDFLFLQVTGDFLFDGYAIIRKDDYDNIRHSSYERTNKKILKAEGLFNQYYGFNYNLPLTSWTNLFRALKSHDFHVIIENFRKDYLDFWIGEIVKVTSKTISLHYYNPSGKLDKQPTNIDLETINIIKFGDNYSTVFRKYLYSK